MILWGVTFVAYAAILAMTCLRGVVLHAWGCL